MFAITMKIQCEVCSKDEALLFCTADDAALCSSCDHRLHRPNLLSSNHHRFPLVHSNNNHFPLCDICQERRAFLFCQQDRAILCKDCDLPIHSVNQLTRNHQRFLLTGVEISTSNLPPVAVASNNGRNSSTTPVSNSSPSVGESFSATVSAVKGVAEYLVEPLPEWHFEDFLDSSSTPPPHVGFYKSN